jgi:uncharacterized protein YndB with AHSA1/START domain
VEVTREIVFPVPPDEVWEALTDPEQLEEWFANDVELDPREGGEGVFRWDDGEERHATVVEAAPGERLVLDWDDDGTVELTLEEVEEGTRLLVRESTPEFSTALELRALALMQDAPPRQVLAAASQ